MLEGVLVVDKDTKARSKFYEIISNLGYKISSVPVASEAFIKLEEERPELILLDENTAGEKIVDMVKKIREFDKDVKIIILSRDGAESMSEGAKDLEVQAEVKKDFSTPQMMKTVLKILKEKKSSQQREPSQDKKIQVMIVDDNSEVRKVLWAFLEKKGYKVSEASSGEAAVMDIRSGLKKPEVVLLDVRMPGMDGLLVLQKIKELDKSIKVVMLTSAQNEELMEEAKEQGASDYLVKPCNFNELDALLSSLLIPE